MAHIGGLIGDCGEKLEVAARTCVTALARFDTFARCPTYLQEALIYIEPNLALPYSPVDVRSIRHEVVDPPRGEH